MFGQVPAGLITTRVVHQQMRELSEMLESIKPLGDRPTADTPNSADLAFVRQHDRDSLLDGLRSWAALGVQRTVMAAREDAIALARLLESDELLPIASMSLARCLMDAAFQAAWLIDTTVDVEARLARWGGRLLHDTQEPPTTLAAFGTAVSPGEFERAGEARQLGQDLMRKAGFTLSAKGGNRSDDTARIEYRSQSSVLAPKMAQYIDERSPSLLAPYILYSGAAHVRGWFLAGLEGDSHTVLGAVVLPLLDVSDFFVVSVADYFGLSPNERLRRTHQRRVALTRNIRPTEGQPIGGWEMYQDRFNRRR